MNFIKSGYVECGQNLNANLKFWKAICFTFIGYGQWFSDTMSQGTVFKITKDAST